MTEMRDGRFKKALETAPDADARPAPAVAQAIRAAARKALPGPVAQLAPRPWWQRLWQSSGNPRAPWGAAFASVLLAVLVTVMWVHEPIPDARPIAPTPASVPTPAAATAPTTETTATEPAPGQATKDAAHSTASTAVAAPPAARLAKPAPTAPRRSAVEPPTEFADNRAAAEIAAPPAAPPAAAPSAANAQTAVPMGLPAQPPLQDQARARGKAYSALAAEGASREAKLPRDESTAPPPAPSALAAAATPATAPAPEPRRGPGRLDGLEEWTALRVELEGRAIHMDRAHGQRLFVEMQRLLLRMKPLPNPVAEAQGTAPTLRLSVFSQGQTLGVMDLWDVTALWRRPGQAEVWANINAAEVLPLLQLSHQALVPAASQ